jgi:thymidylate synthase (FAD)
MIGHKGVLDHGYVELIKVCAEDLDVVNAARVSLHQFSEEMTERDEGLIRFLMRERHGTPFEHGFFKFRIKAPIFVFREWHRHRVGHSYNEWSARYSKLEPEFYIPDKVLTQKGKPGSYTFEEIDDGARAIFRTTLEAQSNEAYQMYENAIEYGVSKQQARLFLPVNTYSEMIWSCNPRSIMHFLSLRDDKNAQYEIREYAKAVGLFFETTMPITYQAFVSNGHKSP